MMAHTHARYKPRRHDVCGVQCVVQRQDLLSTTVISLDNHGLPVGSCGPFAHRKHSRMSRVHSPEVTRVLEQDLPTCACFLSSLVCLLCRRVAAKYQMQRLAFLDLHEYWRHFLQGRGAGPDEHIPVRSCSHTAVLGVCVCTWGCTMTFARSRKPSYRRKHVEVRETTRIKQHIHAIDRGSNQQHGIECGLRTRSSLSCSGGQLFASKFGRCSSVPAGCDLAFHVKRCRVRIVREEL